MSTQPTSAVPALILTNIDVYRAIALEALQRAEESGAAHRRPMPDGHAGSILTPDPTRTSFKQSMIAIVFAGMYLEALLHIIGTKRLGRATYKKISGEEFE